MGFAQKRRQLQELRVLMWIAKALLVRQACPCNSDDVSCALNRIFVLRLVY